MCPLCLASLAVTVATTAGAGATVLALAVSVTRSLRKGETPEPRAPKGLS